jgi:hypothetical protein
MNLLPNTKRSEQYLPLSVVLPPLQHRTLLFPLHRPCSNCPEGYFESRSGKHPAKDRVASILDKELKVFMKQVGLPEEVRRFFVFILAIGNFLIIVFHLAVLYLGVSIVFQGFEGLFDYFLLPNLFYD